MSSTSCCPPDSEPFLAATYTPQGEILARDEAEFYCIGSGAKGVVIIPDVYGWNGGRTRNIADILHSQGFVVTVVKLLTPGLDGGTDGDGLPAGFDFAVRGAEFGPFLRNFSWDTELFPRVLAAIKYMTAERDVTHIGMLGFCFGGWVISKMFASELMPTNIMVGVIAHPSITLEEMVYDGNATELVSKSKRPLVFLPAGNDPDRYRPGGDIFEAIKSSHPTSDTDLRFGDMKHGFVSRGDISDPAIKRYVDLAIESIIKYFREHVAPTSDEL